MDFFRKLSQTQQNLVCILLAIVMLMLPPLIGAFLFLLIMWVWFNWSKKKKLIFTGIFVVLIITLFAPLLGFPSRPMKVSGDSMAPALKSGAYILTRNVDAKKEKLKRGDIVILRSPIDKKKSVPKRIVGLSGDTVAIRNKQIYVGGSRLNEGSYLSPTILTSGGSFLPEGISIFVPKDAFFVVGDNREKSKDSREWGFVKAEDIQYIYLFCYSGC